MSLKNPLDLAGPSSAGNVQQPATAKPAQLPNQTQVTVAGNASGNPMGITGPGHPGNYHQPNS